MESTIIQKNELEQMQQSAAIIRQATSKTAQQIVVIGQELLKVKTLLKDQGSSYLEWLDREFGWSDRHARRFVQVAQEFGSVNLSDSRVAMSALYLLSSPSTPNNIKEEYKAKIEAGESVPHAEVKEAIAKRKATEQRVEDLLQRKYTNQDILSALSAWLIVGPIPLSMERRMSPSLLKEEDRRYYVYHVTQATSEPAGIFKGTLNPHLDAIDWILKAFPHFGLDRFSFKERKLEGPYLEQSYMNDPYPRLFALLKDAYIWTAISPDRNQVYYVRTDSILESSDTLPGLLLKLTHHYRMPFYPFFITQELLDHITVHDSPVPGHEQPKQLQQSSKPDRDTTLMYLELLYQVVQYGYAISRLATEQFSRSSSIAIKKGFIHRTDMTFMQSITSDDFNVEAMQFIREYIMEFDTEGLLDDSEVGI